jgi:rhamnulose-1-phosphate aldolase
MKNLFKSDTDIRQIIKDISEVAGMLWERGWSERNAGNISVNITEYMSGKTDINSDKYPRHKIICCCSDLGGNWFLATGTGGRMRDLTKEPENNLLLVYVDNDGETYRVISGTENPNSTMPTSELPTHLKIHRMIKQRGSGQRVVLHTHASELIALTQLKEYCNEDKINKILWGMHPETMVFVPKGIGLVPYMTPGTDIIADRTIEALTEHDVALWEKHGIFAIGEDIIETFDIIDILAKSAKIFFMCKNAGMEPEGLSDRQLDELRNIDF